MPMHVADLKPRGAPRSRHDDDADPPWFHQHVVWSVVAGAGTIALAGLLLGSLPIKIACLLVGLTVLQGLWRGAAEIIGFVVGMGLALVAAPSLGRAFEPAVGAMTGAGGIMNRVLSVALVALLITETVGVAGSVLAKKFMKHKAHLKAYDKYAGAGLGLLEGSFLALMVLWVPMALAPVARMQVGGDRESTWDGGVPSGEQRDRARAAGLAGEILDFADKTRASFIGGLVEATNPLPDARLLALAADFAAISQDEQALGELLASEPMAQLEALPSIQQAIEAIKSDPEVAGLVDEGGVTTESVLGFFQSNTMLRILDTTTVVQDIAPLAPQLEQAVREARARLEERRRSGGGGGG